MNRAAVLVLVCLATACSPQLSIITPAPPNRVIHLDQEADRIEISEGIGVGVECNRQGLPCKDVRASIAAGKVARVFPAHMNQLSRRYGEQSNVSTIALVGLSPGQTTLRVWSEGWAHDYEVIVLPTPPRK